MHMREWEGPTLSMNEFIKLETQDLSGVTAQPHATHGNLFPVPVHNDDGDIMWPIPLAELEAIRDQDGQESGFHVWRLIRPIKFMKEETYNARVMR